MIATAAVDAAGILFFGGVVGMGSIGVKSLYFIVNYNNNNDNCCCFLCFVRTNESTTRTRNLDVEIQIILFYFYCAYITSVIISQY